MDLYQVITQFPNRLCTVGEYIIEYKPISEVVPIAKMSKEDILKSIKVEGYFFEEFPNVDNIKPYTDAILPKDEGSATVFIVDMGKDSEKYFKGSTFFVGSEFAIIPKIINKIKVDRYIKLLQ